MDSTDLATHRLTILLLCDLLKALESKSDLGLDPARIRDLVEMGHRWALPHAFSSLRDSNEIPSGINGIEKFEQAILPVLCSIHKEYASFHEGEFDAELIANLASTSNRWALPFAYPTISSEMEPPKALVDNILHIFEMWNILEGSIEKLNPIELDSLKTHAHVTQTTLHFEGFDPQSEADAINIAQVLVCSLKNYPRFIGRELTTFIPRLQQYKNLFSKYRIVRNSSRNFDFTELTKIFFDPVANE